MLESLTPEELEAWKRKRRGLDTSLHVALERMVQPEPHHEGPLTHLLTSAHVRHEHGSGPSVSEGQPADEKLVMLPKLWLHHDRHVA